MFGLIKRIAQPVIDLVSEVVTDKDKRAELEYKIHMALQESMDKELQAQRDIIVAEAKSESWITSNWRPLTMLSFVFIIFNNYVLVPYGKAFGAPIPQVEFPEWVGTAVIVGLGGYVVGRSGEKIMKEYKKGK